MGARVPVVDYLVLDEPPHLQAHICEGCDARYFERRNACSRCGGTAFRRGAVSNEGTLAAYTIVHRAAPGIPVPFVSAVVQLADGTWAKANLAGIDPDPEQISLGMPVRLTTYPVGRDDDDVEAVGFAYEPAL